MDILELRKYCNLTQEAFAKRLGIPVGTIRNWEQGIAKPPKYLKSMIANELRSNAMINTSTVKFIKMLDELAELSKNGFCPFYGDSDNKDGLWYDNEHRDEYGFPIPLDVCIDENHHDIISTYDNYCGSRDYYVRVDESNDPGLDEDDKWSITVYMKDTDDMISIGNGRWYFC